MVSEVFYHHQLFWTTKESDIGFPNLRTIDIVSLALRHLHFREMIPLDCHVSKQLTVFWLCLGKNQWVFRSLNYHFLLFPAHSSLLAVLLAAAGQAEPASPVSTARMSVVVLTLTHGRILGLLLPCLSPSVLLQFSQCLCELLTIYVILFP